MLHHPSRDHHELASSGDSKPATAPLLLGRRGLHSHPQPKRKPNSHNLTPQFHWNLNETSLECLTDDERASLYQLFRFYDSSFQGDALPAIHFDRFVELLRDADLLASEDSVDHAVDDELQLHTLERVFAQAVLGKLRSYLDAEAEPALTFQVFCGTLFHCATIKYPDVAPPEAAYKKLLSSLLAAKPRGGSLTVADSSRGLVLHSEHAAIPAWSVEDLHRHLPDKSPTTSLATESYLHREVFQHVLAGLTHDKRTDERLQARLDQLYALPTELMAHFNADTIGFVADRFRTFDVFDQGVIPRDELFAFFCGLAKKLEITDVYEMIAVLLTEGNQNSGDHRKQAIPRGELVLTASSPVTHVSLAQVVQALYVCRRARTASYHTAQRSHQRKTPGGGVATTAALVQSVPGDGGVKDDPCGSGGGTHREIRKKLTRGGGKAERKGTKAKTGGPQAKPSAPSSPSAKMLAKTGKSKRSTINPAVKQAKKQTASDAAILRRLSKMSAASSDVSGLVPGHNDDDDNGNDDDTHSSVHEPDGVVRQSSFASVLASSTSSSIPTVKIPSAATVVVEASSRKLTIAQSAEETTAHEELDRTPQTDTPAAIEASLTLRMFHLAAAGQSHLSLDGALCVRLQLFLVPRPSRIVTTQGIYYSSNGDRLEVWATESHWIDDHLPMESAVVALEQLIRERQRSGFALVPEREQRAAVGRLRQHIRDAGRPQHAAALISPTKPKQSRGHGGGDNDSLVPTSHEHEPRRGGLLVRSSLERGGTLVRPSSSSDLLTMLSDSLLHSNLKIKKRQSILASAASHRGESTRSETSDQSPTGHRVVTPPSSSSRRINNSSGLMAQCSAPTRNDWIVALNSSQSAPVLPHVGVKPTRLAPLR